MCNALNFKYSPSPDAFISKAEYLIIHHFTHEVGSLCGVKEDLGGYNNPRICILETRGFRNRSSVRDFYRACLGKFQNIDPRTHPAHVQITYLVRVDPGRNCESLY